MGLLTQPDPIGIAGGLNLYGYGNGDPVNFRDPFGLCPWCAVAGAGSEWPLRPAQWRSGDFNGMAVMAAGASGAVAGLIPGGGAALTRIAGGAASGLLDAVLMGSARGGGVQAQD